MFNVWKLTSKLKVLDIKNDIHVTINIIRENKYIHFY